MKLISNRTHLVANIETVENYLTDGDLSEKNILLNLIRKGKCLVACKVDKEYRFAPGRFLGYSNNQLNKH